MEKDVEIGIFGGTGIYTVNATDNFDSAETTFEVK